MSFLLLGVGMAEGQGSGCTVPPQPPPGQDPERLQKSLAQGSSPSRSGTPHQGREILQCLPALSHVSPGGAAGPTVNTS